MSLKKGRPVEEGDKEESWWSKTVSRNLEELRNFEMWRSCFGEFVGDFLLAFFTIAVGISKEGDTGASLLQISIGSGFFVAALVTCLLNISGSQLNPAVSIGLWATCKISFVRCIFYSIFQTVGAIAGTAFLQGILPSDYEGTMGFLQPGQGVGNHQAVGMEMVLTGFLTFGILSFFDPGRKDVQGSKAFIIGLIVCVNILAGGLVSGASMNPARAFGPAVVLWKMDKQWIYWVGPISGSLVGAFLYDSFLSTHPISIFRRWADTTSPAQKQRNVDNDAEMTDRL